MKLLCLCCGSVRPQSEDWVNLDMLLPILGRWSEEWKQIQSETNYREFDVESGPLPFKEGEFDGVLFAHALEHFDCKVGVGIMAECRRILKPQGVLVVSVPDASYFRKVHEEDTVENAERLFGEPIHLPDGETTFFGYGLWNRYHKSILTEDAVWAYFRRAGFSDKMVLRLNKEWLGATTSYVSHPLVVSRIDHGALDTMVSKLNRLPFSLVMCGVKE